MRIAGGGWGQGNMKRGAYGECFYLCALTSFPRSTLSVEEFFEEKTGQAPGVVAQNPVFFEQIIEQHAVTKTPERRQINVDWSSSFRSVASGNVGRNGLAVRHHEIDHAVRQMLLDGADVVGKRIARRFTGLRH